MYCLRHALAACLCLGTLSVWAQAKSSGSVAEDHTLSPDATNNNLGPSGIVPFVPGWNASLISSSQHDSGDGWSNLITPAVAYRWNRLLSADVSVPIFLFQNVPASAASKSGTTTTSSTQLQTVHGVPGDTALAGHVELPLTQRLSYTFTPSVSFPSGDSNKGLGSGKVTFDLNNHFELDALLSPYVELGFGNTSGLLNRRIRRAQTSTGKLAHFEVGGSLDLPQHCSFDVSAYEQLPIGDQNIYATRTVRKRTVTQVTGTTGLAEDNGFNASLDVPLQRHVTLSGFYNRSLRQHDDIAGVSITLLGRPKPRER